MKRLIGCVFFGTFFLAGCSVASNFSPATTVTHGADSGAASTQEIKANFPDATDIKVVEAKGNPNYMEWRSSGQKCTAFASAVHYRSSTPGSLISAPYCRKV